MAERPWKSSKGPAIVHMYSAGDNDSFQLFEENMAAKKKSEIKTSDRGRSKKDNARQTTRRGRSMPRRLGRKKPQSNIQPASKSSKVLLEDGQISPKGAVAEKKSAIKTSSAGGSKKDKAKQTRRRGRSLPRRFGRKKVQTKKEQPKIQPQAVVVDNDDDDAGSLWDDASRRSKSSKVLLEDGELAPKSGAKRTSKAKSTKAKSTKANSTKTIPKSPRRPDRKKERPKIQSRDDEDEDDDNDAGSLWDDSSRRSKSSKVLLEDGELVPKAARNQTFRPTNRFKSPIRPKTRATDKFGKPPLAPKKHIPKIRFTSPVRLRSPIRRTRRVQRSTRPQKSSLRTGSFSGGNDGGDDESVDLFSLAGQLVSKGSIAEQIVSTGSDWFLSLSQSYENPVVNTRDDTDEVSRQRLSASASRSRQKLSTSASRFSWAEEDEGEEEDEQEIREDTSSSKDWFNWIAGVSDSSDGSATDETGTDNDTGTDGDTDDEFPTASLYQFAR